MEGDDGGGNEFDLANLGLRLLGLPVPPCWSNGVQRIVDSMAPMVDLLLLQLHCITATVLLCRSRDRSCVDRGRMEAAMQIIHGLSVHAIVTAAPKL